VLVVAADRHPLLARQRRYYRVPALVRRLPGGRAFRPGDPDPLLPFRARRAAAPLPDPAAPTLAGDEDLLAGLVAASNGGASAGPPWSDAEESALASGLTSTVPPAEPSAGAGHAMAAPPHAAATPPPVAEAPATVSCRAAPGQADAPPPRPTATGPGAPAPPGPCPTPSGVAPAPPRLSATQRAVLDALADCGRPTSEVSSAALAARTGINRSTVRAALRELRGKLGLDQGADLVAAARARGLLGGDNGDGIR